MLKRQQILVFIVLIGLFLASCMSSLNVQDANTPQPVNTAGTNEETRTTEVGTTISQSGMTQTPLPHFTTPTISATSQASSPSSTPTPIIPTSTPTPEDATSTVQAQLIITPSLKGPTIGFVQNQPFPPSSILLLDIGAKSMQSIQLPDGQPVRIGRTANQCQFYVLLRRTFGVELAKIDLKAKRFESVFQYHQNDPFREPETFHDEWSISPTGNYVAYIVFAGEHYYATSEFQDVEILSLDDHTEVNRLSIRGGTLSYAWSPNGSQIAFSDYDLSGIRQLYLFDIEDNTLTQLTYFSESGILTGEPMGNYIGEPVWSPDGTAIAVEAGITDEEGNFARSLWIVSVSGDNQLQIIPETTMTFSIMGWSEEGSNLAVYIHNETGEEITRTLYWFNTTDGKILDELDSGVIPDTDITLIGAISGTELWLGQNTQGQLFTFDTLTETIQELSDVGSIGTELFLSLGTRIGEVVENQQIVDWTIISNEFEKSDFTCN